MTQNNLDGDSDPQYKKTVTFVDSEHASIIIALEFYIECIKTVLKTGGLTDIEAYHTGMKLAAVERLFERIK